MIKALKRLAAQIGFGLVAQMGFGLIALLLLLGALCSLLSENADSAETSWSGWGAAPHSASLKESCRKAPESIDGLSMPAPVKEYFKRTLGTDCAGGKEVWLTPDMSLKQMWSGPDSRHKGPYVMDDKKVAELPVLRSPDGRSYRKGAVAETAKALSWTYVYEGKTYVLYLPLVCFNWSWAETLRPVMTPRLVCYEIPLDYRHTPGVVWDKRHAARIEIHLDGLSGAELERLARDPCFTVSDATGVHVPYHRCDVCESSGGQWPPAGLAKAVGLPEKEPSGIFTAPIADGVGIVSLPRWAVVYLGVYCVDVEGYQISVPGYERWTAITRFDLVTPDEMHRTLPKGKLDRVLSGVRHY